MRAKPLDPTFPHDGRFQHISTMAVTLEQAFIDVHVLSYSLVVECSCMHTQLDDKGHASTKVLKHKLDLQHRNMLDKNYCALYGEHMP